MRGGFPIELTIGQRCQLIAWSHMETPGGMRRRDTSVILKLADGHLLIQVAKEVGISRQTVSKVRRSFLIFGLDGIWRNVPRLGRKSSIRGEKADAVLKIAWSETPFKGCRWTGQQLARRCELSPSALYRFLRKHDISLNDSRTIKGVINGAQARILEVAGLFISASISVMAFWCRPSKSPVDIGPSLVIMRPRSGENLALFSRESEKLLHYLTEIQFEFSRMRPKRTDCGDIVRFMKILQEKTRGKREVLLVMDPTDITAGIRLMRWLEPHLHFHLDTSQKCEPWVGELREHIGSVWEDDRRVIALQLEHLNSQLGEWRDGPCRRLGVFASTITLS